MASGYDWLSSQHSKVDGHIWVWNRFNVPIHKFTWWLTCWNRLRTMDVLKRYKVLEQDNCPLCYDHSECSTHLFLDCLYSKKCCIKLNCSVDFSSIPACYTWLNSNQGRFKRQAVQSCIAALFYHTWHQRNLASWLNYVNAPDYLIDSIKGEEYHTVISIVLRSAKSSNIRLLNSLFNHVS